MGGTHILVLGGTGPAGICLLRELLYREHPTVAYVRNPSKIPGDLSSNPLLQVCRSIRGLQLHREVLYSRLMRPKIIEGEMSDIPKLSSAVAQSSVVISLLGPNSLRMTDPELFANFYQSSVFPLMREHSVKRILAMGTISIREPEDKPSWLRWLLVLVVRLLASVAYRNILNIAETFRNDAQDLDWTVFRIANIPGGSDEADWAKDREECDAFVGYVGDAGWSLQQRRGSLARWLVDAVEGGADEWIGKLPAVSRLAGSKKSA